MFEIFFSSSEKGLEMWKIFPSSIRRNPWALTFFGKTQDHPDSYMIRKLS